MKYLICGSREDFDEKKVKEHISWLIGGTFHSWDVVYLGGAKGVDTIAEKEIKKNQWHHEVQIEIRKPDYEKYGKSAPIIRNHEMVDEVDFVICFWNGYSNGTQDVIQYAKKKKKQIKVLII